MQVRPFGRTTQKPDHMTIATAAVMLFVVFIALSNLTFCQGFDNDLEGDAALPQFYLSLWEISPLIEALPVIAALVSIFMLLVDYKGGRSRHIFYNDRTIEFMVSYVFVFLGRLSSFEAVLFFICRNKPHLPKEFAHQPVSLPVILITRR